MIVCITFIQSYEFGYNIKEKASINADLLYSIANSNYYFFVILRYAAAAVTTVAAR